eukprot:403370529
MNRQEFQRNLLQNSKQQKQQQQSNNSQSKSPMLSLKRKRDELDNDGNKQNQDDPIHLQNSMNRLKLTDKSAMGNQRLSKRQKALIGSKTKTNNNQLLSQRDLSQQNQLNQSALMQQHSLSLLRKRDQLKQDQQNLNSQDKGPGNLEHAIQFLNNFQKLGNKNIRKDGENFQAPQPNIIELNQFNQTPIKVVNDDERLMARLSDDQNDSVKKALLEMEDEKRQYQSLDSSYKVTLKQTISQQISQNFFANSANISEFNSQMKDQENNNFNSNSQERQNQDFEIINGGRKTKSLAQSVENQQKQLKNEIKLQTSIVVDPIQIGDPEVKHQVSQESKQFLITGRAFDYKLDESIDPRQINKKLEKAPKFKRGRIDYARYPVHLADQNSIQFLKNEIMIERQKLYKYYTNQGYLGRTLICLIDKMILGTFKGFDRIQQLKNMNKDKSTEGSRVGPSVMIRDRDIPEQHQLLKTMEYLTSRTVKLQEELQNIRDYLRNIKVNTQKIDRSLSSEQSMLTIDKNLQEKLERDSISVSKLKARIMQRNLSVDKITKVDIALFSNEDQKLIQDLIKLETQKIQNMISSQGSHNKRLHDRAKIFHLTLETYKDQNDQAPLLLSSIKLSNQNRVTQHRKQLVNKVQRLSQKQTYIKLIQHIIYRLIDKIETQNEGVEDSLYPTYSSYLTQKIETKSLRAIELHSKQFSNKNLQNSTLNEGSFNNIINFL